MTLLLLSGCASWVWDQRTVSCEAIDTLVYRHGVDEDGEVDDEIDGVPALVTGLEVCDLEPRGLRRGGSWLDGGTLFAQDVREVGYLGGASGLPVLHLDWVQTAIAPSPAVELDDWLGVSGGVYTEGDRLTLDIPDDGTADVVCDGDCSPQLVLGDLETVTVVYDDQARDMDSRWVVLSDVAVLQLATHDTEVVVCVTSGTTEIVRPDASVATRVAFANLRDCADGPDVPLTRGCDGVIRNNLVVSSAGPIIVADTSPPNCVSNP
ncbi:MAG: hypothetical protein KC656_21155 [Myxococcales bacterium]|nr:hypothetical protein [Myxococcales bacterium]